MDYVLFQHPPFPHNFITPRRFHRSFAAPQKSNRLLSSACWAIRGHEIGAQNLFDKGSLKGNKNGSSLAALEDSSLAPFATPDAEITPETIDFFVSDAEGDPDFPSEGFSSIEQAFNVLRQGEPKSGGSRCRPLGPSLRAGPGNRRKRENLVERTSVSRLPTEWGLFEAYYYRSKLDGTEHIAVVKGKIGHGQDVLVRVQSECLTGGSFRSARCDCRNQLELAMQLIEQAGRGVLVYLRGHEGRGIGLGHKLQAYNLQDQGHDTVDANLELGFAADTREYGIGAQILRDIGVRTMRLMTNNPAKVTGLKGYDLAVVERVPVLTPITAENRRYLETKRIKMGHVYGSDIQEPMA